MSGATGSGGTEAFAGLLRELKDRSGLSYGTLAKRLHMSTSTLHRYCNGTALPVDYAPVERLARVCRATPEELVELHRRWILADAARGSRADQGAATVPGRGVGPKGSTGSAGSGGPTGPAGSGNQSEGEGDSDGDNGPDRDRPHDEPVLAPSPGPRRPRDPRRRRTVLVSAVAVAAVLGALVLTVRPTFGGGDHAGDRRAGDTPATADTGRPSATPAPGAKRHRPSPSPSSSASRSGQAGSEAARSGASKGAGAQQGGTRPTGGATDGVPLTVGTRPYVYDSPCSQHFLVDSEPEQVGPPANEQDAPRWAAAYGAVSSGEQRIALTVQGTGEDTVVLEALHVRVLARNAPLAWNDYSMGVGCGGGVATRSFDIGLDAGSPAITVENGQRAFPYKVSESDPEVFYVTARTGAHDVRWDLTLDWSSGDRRGTVHVDDHGTPFRTSADVDRPGYDYPLGGGEWIERTGG
ncbi:helix-turn-helix transcriptional regulator [Streptomyces sp. NPDC005574]|uniref:helix-turn-helix domain-containing protein n=1 Tax=Streptomyces sp. NPDC005574 TaxID=3156891 RepID=UPI0033BB524B